jgi:hypothetical protein
MAPRSPSEALGVHADDVRDLLVDVARYRHDLAAEAHQAASTRYAMTFGSQWRDLLDDTCEALVGHGFEAHRLEPAGYKLPVVNNCLVWMWRVPERSGSVERFGSTPTRKNAFAVSPPPPMLFDASVLNGAEPGRVTPEHGMSELELMAQDASMPVVLVMVQSSPRQLQSIQWAIGKMDEDSGKIHLLGAETIWELEHNVEVDTSDVESFDSGTPVAPAVELQEQEGPLPDA